MTTEDLIARLRDTTALSDPLLTHEAADALEALGREIERLTQRLKMTTNLLSVIEQQQKALNICIAKHYDLAEDVRIGDAIAAGKQALEQTQVGKPSIELPTIHEVEYRRVRGEAQKLAVSLWTKHYRDDAPQWTVLSDTLGALSQISNMVAGMVRPQATEPAPSTDICQNCAGQGWEPSVNNGKVPCSFCHPAPSTAGEWERIELERWGRSENLCLKLLDRMDDGYWTPWHIATESLALMKSRIDALAADLTKAQDELNCTEQTLEAASCELSGPEFENGFDCMGDFAMAVWQGFKKELITLRTELAAIRTQEPVAWIFPNDVQKLQESETFVNAFSVKCGSPDGITLPFYTSPVVDVSAGLVEALEELQRFDSELTMKSAWSMVLPSWARPIVNNALSRTQQAPKGGE